MNFKLTYWTRRWSAKTTLTLVKTESGWHISHMAINGDTDREGTPILEANLHQDNVSFPNNVGAFLGFVWDELESGNIDAPRAQDLIEEIGGWISACESSQPVWRGWNC